MVIWDRQTGRTANITFSQTAYVALIKQIKMMIVSNKNKTHDVLIMFIIF